MTGSRPRATLERAGIAVELVALGLWAGTMAGFAFVFAPIAFATIHDLRVFGAMIARIIDAIGSFGLACALVAVAGEAMRFAGAGRARVAALRLVLIAVALGASSVESHAIVPQMTAAAAEIPGALDSVPKTDPRRAAYDALHARSSQVYGAAFLAVVASLATCAFGRRRAETSVGLRRIP